MTNSSGEILGDQSFAFDRAFIEDLAGEYREWTQVKDRLRDCAGRLGDEFDCLDELASFEFFEAIDGRLYPCHFDLVQDEAELRAHPERVLFEPGEAVTIFTNKLTGKRACNLTYSFIPPEQRFDTARFYTERGFDPVVWIGVPAGEEVPVVGISEDEWIKRVASSKHAKEWHANRGDFKRFASLGYERITNAIFDSAGEPCPYPLDAPHASLKKRIIDRFAGYPASCGRSLFIPNGRAGVDWLESPDQLFAWLATFGELDWHRNRGYVTQKQFFEELRRDPPRRYVAIEELPHEPAIAGHFYTMPPPRPGDGSALKSLIDRFRPETTVDRDLLAAMLVSPLWGGPPGARPAFVLTSDAGRGSGKSKTAEIIATALGGYIDVSSGEDIGVIKQRLLTPEATSKRIVMLDNVKSLRFSWAELESLITTSSISGKRMYVGEASRPNLLTWFITLNGVSLATDMAQRSVIIKLAKGENQATWYEETIAFVRENRDRLLADAIALLRRERFPLAKFSRWAAWERDVLCRLPEPGEAQRVILERQGEADAEADESGIIEDFVADMLADKQYRPEAQAVRIPVAILADWYRQATGDHKARTAGISRQLRQLAREGTLKRLRPDPSRSNGRCFIWTGEFTGERKDILNDLEYRLANRY